ncbi:MAG: 4Fe-4S dicluster domain-containing protein [Prevotellaceae bacterium]|jgi:heterodisulfide reductase subunit C|nr:4Fe-4S dicluster domain-containing protein [Prevotellaceae bacterium]
MSEKKELTSEIRAATGVNVNRCYQCGKCSAGCALNESMDYPPSVVMRMLQTNSAESFDKTLRSQSIWLCASCQCCIARCPMQIDIPRLMDYLRARALEKKTVNRNSKKIVAFHRAFLDSVKYTGRLYEVGLVVGYKARTLSLLQDLSVAPRMLMKGKLPLIPERVKGRKLVKKFFQP